MAVSNVVMLSYHPYELKKNYCTKLHNREYRFKFKGAEYFTHSIVRLKESGKKYLQSKTLDVVLTEVFTGHDGKVYYKYKFVGVDRQGIIDRVTGKPPDKMIESIIMPSFLDWAIYQDYGVDSPYWTVGKKESKKDWEIPEVRRGWVVLILVFIVSAIFKDWYIKLIIRCAAGWYFGLYRQAYVGAYTTYTNDEFTPIKNKTFEVLYQYK